MSRQTVHFIDGSWRSGSGEAIISLNPATGAPLWEGASAQKELVEEAVAAAREAFPRWAATPFNERVEALHRFQQELEFGKQELAEAISKEVGKPLWESKTEVAAMIGKIGISIEAYGERCKELKSETAATISITRHKPHGVIAVFGPFNFPGHLPNGHIVPALLAGNTIVFKPSEQAPLVAEMMVQAWEKAHLPQGVLNMVQGGRETGAPLAQHPGIDGLFFTGSWQTGQHFMKTYGAHPGKILALEMGGNNPLIIWEAKNLGASAYLTLLSAFLTSGQRCTCARRLIVANNDQGEKLINVLREMMANIRIAPYDEKPDAFMGPVISADAVSHLLEAQEALKKMGGDSLIEMRPLKRGTGLITPGLMDVSAISDRNDTEYFGPFLQVIRVDSFEEAILEANNTEYGLSAGLFSSSAALYEKFRLEARAGIVNWNTPLTGASSRAPFGGIGKSGNFRPSAFYAADYCAYPVASMESSKIAFPENPVPGINIQRHV